MNDILWCYTHRTEKHAVSEVLTMRVKDLQPVSVRRGIDAHFQRINAGGCPRIEMQFELGRRLTVKSSVGCRPNMVILAKRMNKNMIASPPG